MASDLISPFHPGEQLIQHRLGIRDQIQELGRRIIRNYMPDQHRRFFCQVPYVLLGHTDNKGWPWASALCHPDGTAEGFIDSPNKGALVIPFAPLFGDPLNHGLQLKQRVGLLGIELSNRRRNRLSATVTGMNEGSIEVSVDQSFGNCPKYINARSLVSNPTERTPRITASTKFNKCAKDIIKQADTFFVASYAGSSKRSNPDMTKEQVEGVDVSHRGGKQGFVSVDGNELHIPDYPGNNFFNTLGNFVVNPKAGLTFIDFKNGDIVMLTGTIMINWHAIPELRDSQVQRSWSFTPRKVLIISQGFPYVSVE